MADDFKSIRENLFKAVIGGISESRGKMTEEEAAADSIASLRTLFGTITARAGKGKDEVVQILAREIGIAVAAMLREPLSELAKHQRLQVTFELVPKSGHVKAEKTSKAPAKKKVSKRKKKTVTSR